MTVSYSKTSPYFNTGTFGIFLDVLVVRPITAQPDDVVYQIDKTYEYRPDLLAYDLYGDSSLWWVFRSRNPDTIDDPIEDFRAGTIIYLPKKTTLTSDLGI